MSKHFITLIYSKVAIMSQISEKYTITQHNMCMSLGITFLMLIMTKLSSDIFSID